MADKILIGPQLLIYPMPTVLVGANVDHKPNFMAVAWCGIANDEPPMVSVAIRPERYTHRGIEQNATFSVNVPSTDLVKETDYCGIESGAKVNKAEVCNFTVFYGKSSSAPLIEECPVNLECKVVHTLHLGTHSLFIGQVTETHISESCFTNGKPDVSKFNAFVYTSDLDYQYQALGKILGRAFNIGKGFRGSK
jgi:flavin reductase (DIM6/NTAB) family NADH-FMN oxidoreductase RutF